MIVTGKTNVVGIFGCPIEHSMSPQMHNRAFEYLSLDYCYVPFLVTADQIETAVSSVRSLGLRGVNVTIPHKQAVIPYLDELSPEAALIGAVNTIVNREGKLIGYNTDGQGFVKSMNVDAGVNPQGKTIVLLGAGGAARGVGVQLALSGAGKIILLNRTLEKAEEIARLISKNTQAEALGLNWTPQFIEEALREADIVVNTTSIGMYPKCETMPDYIKDCLRADLVVADLIYNPVETNLLIAASSLGCSTLSGLGMLLYQGAIAFELWTGKEAPIPIMQEILRFLVEKR